MADTCKQLTVVYSMVSGRHWGADFQGIHEGPDPALVSLSHHHCFLPEGVKCKDKCRNQGTTLLCIQSSTQLPATQGSGVAG